MKNVIKWVAVLCAATSVWTANAATDTSRTNIVRPSATMSASDLFTNVVARGKGVSVTRAQLDEALIGIKSSAIASGRSIPPEQMNMLERQILQRLIQVQLLNQKATEADRQAGKDLAEKRLAEIRERAGSDEKLEQQLKSIGFTRSVLAVKMAEEATAETVLKRELNAQVGDAEVKKFYEDNPAKFEQPEMVRAAHVLIGTRDSATQAELSDEQKAAKRKQAEDILKRARAGEDFGKLAQEFSDDPGSKEKGGEYTFPRGQMVPEFEEAAFSLNTNQVSDIVTTMFGFHIIKLYEKLPAKKVEFEKVQDDIKEFLAQQEMQQKLPDYMEKLEADASVEVLDENLKPVRRPPTGATGNSPTVRPPSAQ